MLTICIPTFNRAHQLEENLSKIVQVIKKENMSLCVSVVIADNCSTDNTKSMLADYVKKYSFIKCIHQTNNVGFYNNVLSLWKNIQTEYVWTISDDDYYSEDLISTLIKMDYTNINMNLVVLNSFHYLKDSSRAVKSDILNIRSTKIIEIFDSLSSVITDKSFTGFGLLASAVIPNDTIKSYIQFASHVKTSEISLNYPHQYIIFKYHLNKPIMLLNYESGLGWKMADSNWNLDKPQQSLQAHYFDYVKIIELILIQNTNIEIDKIYKTVYFNSYFSVLLAVIYNNVDIRWAAKHIFKNHYKYKFISPIRDLVLCILIITKSSYLKKLVLKRIMEKTNTK